jgi:hypothetical protein
MHPWDFGSNFSKGQLLCIELEDRSYYGNFLSRSKDKARIELTNVRAGKDDPATNKRLKFYRSEVQAIKSDEPPAQAPVDIPELPQPAVAVATKIGNYTYISEFRAQYRAAVADLQDQDFIGLNMEGKSLLVIAANQNIYIFDMLQMGGLRADLKQILEGNSPLKVCHGGGHACKRLQKKYNCALNPVFDTRAAHSRITASDAPISVEKCVNLYLQTELPEMEAVLDDIRSEDQLLIAARRVAFLVKLFDHLVHEVALKKMTSSCQKYVTSLSKVEDASEAGFAISSGANPAIKLIEDFEKLELFVK